MVRSLFENLREKAVRKKIPIVIHFDITYQCNLRCVHCYIVPEDRPELNVSEIKDILNQLTKAGTLYLTLSGGEILTRKDDFFKIAFYARELSFALRLLTNGTLIDEEIADKIAYLSPELVGISIYSMDSKIHDSITGQLGSFQKSILAVKILKERGVKVKLSTVIMKQNIEDYHSIYEFSQGLKAHFQADYRIAPRSDGNRCPLKFHINDKDLYRILCDPIFSNEDEPDPVEDYSGVFNSIPCGASHMSCYISPYGDIYPCVQLPIDCGNLRQETFGNIWKNSPQMLDVRSVTIFKLSLCSKCDLFQFCRLCIGLNYVEEGNMFLPSKRSCKEAEILKKLEKKRR